MKRILAVILMAALLLGTLPLGTANAETMEVTGGWLRLRSAPSYEAETISSYYTGTRVTVLAVVSGWYHVRTPDGKTGYMLADYLIETTPMDEAGTAEPTNPSPSPRQATVTSPNGRGVKLRTGPSTGYGVIMVCPVGTVATILLEGDQWHYIRVGDKMGYMMAQYLSTGSPVTPSGYLAHVWSGNGYGVRLRSGPGTWYDVLGMYSVGTAVTVLEYGPEWCKIRVGSRVGYMMTEFLTTSQVVTSVTSVSLNITAPRMGDVLTAYVQPAGATVTYRWTDASGNLLSTASSYAVTAYDVGKRIRVTVTGTGMYTGTAKSALTSAVVYNDALTGVYLSSTAPVVGDTITATAEPAGAKASYAWYRSDGAYLGSGRSYRVKSADVGCMLYCKATGTGSYTGEVYSGYTDPVAYTPGQTALSGSLTLSNTAEAGDKLTVQVNLNASNSDVTFRWFADNVELPGATTRTITVQEYMKGQTLHVTATAKSGSGYTGSVTSNVCRVMSGETPVTPLSGKVTIPSSAAAGEVITARLNLNSDSVTYTWYLNGSRISGATGHQLTLNNAMVGGDVYVVVTAADSEFTGSVTSNSCYVSMPGGGTASATDMSITNHKK